MGFNEAIPCCCEKQKKVCCITATYERRCLSTNVGSGDCVDTPGPFEWLAYTTSWAECVDSQEECDNFAVSNPCGDPLSCDIRLVSATSEYFPDENCIGDEPQVSQDFCGPRSYICQKFECGTCTAVPQNCTTVETPADCPPVPSCPPQPCCDPDPGDNFCCCITISGGCILSTSCGPGTCPPSSGNAQSGVFCYQTSSCVGCSNISQGTFITTMCCATCQYLDVDGDGVADYFVQDCQGQPTGVCCSDCQTPNCAPAGCVRACPSASNICPCPVKSIGGACVTQSNLRYGSSDTSAEGRYTSGFMLDKGSNTPQYVPNSLFLFGYGYDRL